VPHAPGGRRAWSRRHAAPGAACLVRRSLTSETIPLAVLTGIARAVETIRAWNATMTRARALAGGTRRPGRHQYAGKRLRARLEQALRTLAYFETRAQALGIPSEALYTACGGKPVVEPEAAAVWEWRHRRAGAPPATPSPASLPVPLQDGSRSTLAPAGEIGPGDGQRTTASGTGEQDGEQRGERGGKEDPGAAPEARPCS
jgi:hypothetical protein